MISSRILAASRCMYEHSISLLTPLVPAVLLSERAVWCVRVHLQVTKLERKCGKILGSKMRKSTSGWNSVCLGPMYNLSAKLFVVRWWIQYRAFHILAFLHKALTMEQSEVKLLTFCEIRNYRPQSNKLVHNTSWFITHLKSSPEAFIYHFDHI